MPLPIRSRHAAAAKFAGCAATLCAFVVGYGGLAAAATAAPAAVPKSVIQAGNGDGVFGMMAVAWMPDGKHVVTASYGGFIIVWDPVKGQIVDRLGQTNCQLRLRAGDAGQLVVPRDGPTNCLDPTVPDVDDSTTWLQPKSLQVAPDGRYALMVGEAAGDLEVQVFNLENRTDVRWLHRRPRLWIGQSRSRLIVAPADVCAGPADTCGLSVVDPATLAEIRVGARFGDGQMMVAAPQAERFAAVVGGTGGRQDLVVWSSTGLSETARFDLGVGSIAEIGFDAAGGQAFARKADGTLAIFDLAGKTVRRQSLRPFAVAGTARHAATHVVLTDIDSHSLLVGEGAVGSGGIEDSFNTRLVDYQNGRVRAASHGTVSATFPHQGAVIADGDHAAYLDVTTGVVQPLDRSFQGGRAAIDETEGPSLALSPDGGAFVSTAGRIGTVARPDHMVSLSGFPVLHFPDILPSPDGRRFAVARSDSDSTRSAAWVFDLDSGRFFPALRGSAAAGTEGVPDGWLSDSELVVRDAAGGELSVNINSGAVRALTGAPALVSPYAAAAGDGTAPACKPDQPRPPDKGDVVVQALCYAWAWHGDGGLAFMSARDWRTLFWLFIHPDGTWFAKGADDPDTASSRYDTDQSADTSDVRWLMPNRPWTSLPAQTYMRYLYQPRLTAKLLDCNFARNCRDAFGPPTDLAALNTLLPDVRILDARQEPGRDTVSVVVQAQNTHDSDGVGHTDSGVFDLRLFRDGKLVGQWPDPKPEAKDGVGDFRLDPWQEVTMVPGGLDRTPISHTFHVALPTNNGARKVAFTAYAFNDSRVKGETAIYSYVPPTPPVPRPRRAYVITIGVNSYSVSPDLTLHFAANDARDLSRALQTFLDAVNASDPRQPYRVVPVTLVSDAGGNQATKADIRAVLAVLAGQDDAAGHAVLDAARIKAADLAKATPDDVVILAFSGHGWANARGDFYLLPSDARMPEEAAPETLATLISSAELTDALRGVDAGEMAIIIDACHSAGSVDARGFKPGPMGDPGLGQLAYDKGIRILAATQDRSVAMERAALHGGLLTYALAHDGLGDGQRKPKAAADADGHVVLDDLLKYALDAVPGLEEQTASDRHGGLLSQKSSPMLVRRGDTRPAPPIQQPSLFDFTGAKSPVAVARPQAPPEEGLP